MENEKKKETIGVEISFPSSEEDHRLQLVLVNDAIFAILFAPLESKGPIQLHCEEWNLILLAPIKSKKEVVVRAENIARFATIESETEEVRVEANKELVDLSPDSLQKTVESDADFFVNYFQLCQKIVQKAREDSSEALAEAQKRVLTALCLLAQKASGKQKELTIEGVLDFWGIEYDTPS